MVRAGLILTVLAGIAALPAIAVGADRIELPPGPNRDLVYSRCRTCHDLQYIVESAGITRDNWVALIEDMGQYGLRIPKDERDKIIEYLSVYLGPNAPAGAEPPRERPPAADGEAVFARQCTSCHQPQGTGLPKTFPPLAGNPDLFLDRLFPVYVVLNGIKGAITVKGESYESAMPPFDYLSDAEVAAVVNYVRSAWGNTALRPAGFADVDAAAVREARGRPMTPEAVHAFRSAHR